MADPILSMRCLDMKTRYDMFIESLSTYTRKNKMAINMRNYDLVFFPMQDGCFYYVVVVNLKNPTFTIIDNRKWKEMSNEMILRKYSYIPEILLKVLRQHLIVVRHPAAQLFKEVELERLVLDWQTIHNSYDNGVFAMRHMETFMGDTKWKCGIAACQKQESQLEDLRKKYVLKITLHPNNNLKDAMAKEVQRFYTMNDELREHVLRTANDSRWGTSNIRSIIIDKMILKFWHHFEIKLDRLNKLFLFQIRNCLHFFH